MAPRHGAGPGDDPLVGDARGAGGPRERHDGDRRPPRVPQRHRGQPGRDRRGVRHRRGPCVAGLRGHGPPRARWRSARARRERALHPGRWSGSRGDPCRLHLLRRVPARRGRPGRGPWRRGPRPRLRGRWRRRRTAPTGRADARRLAPGALRPPAHGSRAAGNDPPQPDVEPQQRRRLREPGPLREPGRPRHRRDRRQRPRGVPAGLRPAALGRRHLRAGHGLVLARSRLEPGTGGPRRRRSNGRTTRWTPGTIAFTPGIMPRRITVGGQVVFADGSPTRVDADEIRAKAREQAARLHARL